MQERQHNAQKLDAPTGRKEQNQETNIWRAQSQAYRYVTDPRRTRGGLGGNGYPRGPLARVSPTR